MRKIKKVLCLGGAGFIGKEVVRSLLKQGVDVHCLVNRTPLGPDITKRVTQHKGNLATFDWSSLPKDFDAIIHLARISGVRTLGRIFSSFKGKYANKRLLAWMEESENPPTLVYVAGTLAYGSRPGTCKETWELNPVAFAKEYCRAEEPVFHSCKEKELPIMIMRAPWVIGRGSWFTRFFSQEKAVPIYGDGKNLMSTIHVQDCAGLIIHYLKHGEVHEQYNLFSTNAVSQKKFSQELAWLQGKGTRLVPLTSFGFLSGRGARDALCFSLAVGTKHQQLMKKYKFTYPTLKEQLSASL